MSWCRCWERGKIEVNARWLLYFGTNETRAQPPWKSDQSRISNKGSRQFLLRRSLLQAFQSANNKGCRVSFILCEKWYGNHMQHFTELASYGEIILFSIMYDLSMECYAPNTKCKVGWFYLHCVYTVEYVPGHKYTPIFTYVNQMTFRSCYPLLLRAYNMRYKIIITRLAISLELKKIIAFSICSEMRQEKLHASHKHI